MFRQLFERQTSHSSSQASQSPAVGERTDSIEARCPGLSWSAPWINHRDRLGRCLNQRPRFKGLQVKPFEIELSPRFGITGLQHLKTVIESKSIDLIGSNPTTNASVTIDDADIDTLVDK